MAPKRPPTHKKTPGVQGRTYTLETPDRIDDTAEIRALVREFLVRVAGEFSRADLVFDVDANMALTFGDLDAYLPPEGRVILARSAEGTLDGCVFLHQVGDSSCEIKRLWVRPTARGAGLGRRMMEHALAEARGMGLNTVLLDTGEWDTAAHRLYRRLGFVEVDAFPESQVPPELQERLLFFRLDFSAENPG